MFMRPLGNISVYGVITSLALLLFSSVAMAAERGAEPALADPELGVTPVPTGQTTSYTYRPDGDGPFPAVFFLQGYPCRTASPDDDRNLARNRLIAHYVAAGFLVYMVEKPGLGGGKSSTPCRDLLYNEEVEAFAQGLDELRNHADVQSENIFLFGHSMGGQTAPLIAGTGKVRGIITYGIHAKPWFEFMIDISRAQSERLGMDPVAVNGETAIMIPFLYDLMVAKEDWDVLSSRHADALAIGILSGEGPYLNGRHYRFWASLNDASFIDAWAEYEGKVLAIYGEYDIASISPEGAERIAHIVNYHHPGNARALVLDKSGHGFATVDGSFDDYKKARFTPDWVGAKEASYFNMQLADETIEWMRQVMSE